MTKSTLIFFYLLTILFTLKSNVWDPIITESSAMQLMILCEGFEAEVWYCLIVENSRKAEVKSD